MNLTVVEGDLLDQDVNVIVNAWNRNIIPWWLPQGVSGAIKKRGGTGPFKELGKYGAIPLGEAVLTSAGKLPFKGIIHVAGINMLWRASEKSIRDSVKNAILRLLSGLSHVVIGIHSNSLNFFYLIFTTSCLLVRSWSTEVDTGRDSCNSSSRIPISTASRPRPDPASCRSSTADHHRPPVLG